MISSEPPSAEALEAAGAGGEFCLGVDLRRLGTEGEGSSTTLISLRRLLTPFVERALRRGSIHVSCDENRVLHGSLLTGHGGLSSSFVVRFVYCLS